MNEHELKTGTITVSKLLQYKELAIPVYQRPYKWTVKNVNQLINDIFMHKNKPAYRLGTLVIHNEKNTLNIVDGQQRTISLVLIAKAIFDNPELKIKNPELDKQLKQIKENIFWPTFNNEVTIQNIQINYKEIVRQVAAFDEELINFLFNKCEFIQFILTDISEAFQFFDAQNARGKDLEPHDLLKAFHLREFSKNDEIVKTQVVETWESMETNELSNLFGEYLFRIKSWSKGNSARYFTKDQTEMFKGINIEKVENFPYTEILRIAHYYIDRYNSSYERNIDFNKTSFPFQLDQTIINGRRFFEMISHYKRVLDRLSKSLEDNAHLNGITHEIIKTINDYDGMYRVGDGYVRMMFDCALIYYIDKFGLKDLPKAIEKIFIWAYTIRLRHQSVQLASVDNYVLEEINLFKVIKEASNTIDVISIYLEPLSKNNSSKTSKIENLFKKLKYYDN